MRERWRPLGERAMWEIVGKRRIAECCAGVEVGVGGEIRLGVEGGRERWCRWRVSMAM